MLLKYNPKKIVGSWSGTVKGREFAIKFTGFMDGTFIEADYDEDHVTKHVGADGTASAILNANLGAIVTVTFVQGAAVNRELSKYVPNARNNFLPVGTLKVEDLNGDSVIKAAEAWIKKRPKLDFGKDIAPRPWMFDTGEAEINVGAAENF
jgi:hypothetical protein